MTLKTGFLLADRLRQRIEKTMPSEYNFIERLKSLATNPAARGLADDCAVISGVSGDLVVTHDMIAEGVHFLPESDPADIGWRLVAVNLSDLASSGAKPLGVLMGYSLSGDAAWDARFIEGVGQALSAYDVPLLGGDTVRLSAGAQRSMGLTALGLAPACGAPSRKGAKAGDALWVTGTIGDAGAGLALAERGLTEPVSLLRAHNRPAPRLADGQALAPVVKAMMDVSDGLLVDAGRLANASGVAVTIALDAVPLSAEYVAVRGSSVEARIWAATAGDDYQLLFALADGEVPPVAATRVGICGEGKGLSLTMNGADVPLLERLGYLH